MSFHPFSVAKTRESLREDALSQRDEMRYWFFSSVIWLFYFYHSAWLGLSLDWFLIYEVAVALVVLWIGLSESFKANGGDAGPDFLRRVVLLGTPLGLAVLVASQALYWLGWWVFPRVIDYRSFRDPAFAWQVVNFVCFNGIQIWFWWRLHHHLRVLNQPRHHE